MHAVTLRDISMRFGNVEVLKGLSLDIEPGEFLVLLGSSGCGKSTLLSVIAGLEDPTGGSVWFGDNDVTDRAPSARGIAMVFQSYALYPTMSVRENLAFGLRMARVSAADTAERVARAAQLLQLEPYLDRRPGQLSGGQRQRVAIGRALVRRSDVYLFDEPLSNLDAKLRAEMRLEIKKLHSALGATMIYVTHDQIEAMTMATRVALLRDGVIEQLAPPAELYNRPLTRYAAEFVGSPQINIFDGTLDKGFVRLDGSTDTLQPAAERCAALRSNTNDMPVWIGLRPEHLALSSEAGWQPLIRKATVDVVEFTGADAVVWATKGSMRMCARVPTSGAPGSGELVDLFADPAGLSVFDRTTGRRL